jgi:SAM-dependent methyltransferase
MKATAKKILKKLGLYDWVLPLYLYGIKMSKQPGILLVRSRNQWLRVKCATVGLPLPSPALMHTVAGTSDVKWFLKAGGFAAESIREILRKNKIEVDSLRSVLDLGCGCGRVIRHLKLSENAELHGTDYNPELIEWCKAKLKFARFDVNDLRPPLGYSNSQFDFVYALSVFTHLPEDLQFSWMSELRRVIGDGGYLLITTHGRYYLDQLTPTEQQQFQKGQLVVRDLAAAGTNYCATFHAEEYVRTKLAEGFEVLDFIPEGAKGNPRQDVFLLKKILE